MIVQPLVLTIPHSGTRSLVRCIYSADYGKPRQFKHVAHRNHRSFVGLPSGRTIISPLRNPKEMWKSWVARYNNTVLAGTIPGCSPYPTRRGPGQEVGPSQCGMKKYVRNWAMAADVGMHPLDLFEEQWRCLSEFDKEYEIFYVPIDLECTEERIIELSAILGRKLSFDKDERLGHESGNYETDYPGPDLDYIYSIPFVSKFYEARR